MKATILSVLGTIAVGVVAQELEIEVTYAVECTNKTQKGDFISVNYNGTFTNGTTFDSSSQYIVLFQRDFANGESRL